MYGCGNAEVQHLQNTRPPPLAGEIADEKWGDQIISFGDHLPSTTPSRFVAQWRGWIDSKSPSGGEDIQPSTKLPSGGVVLWNGEEIGLPIDGSWSSSVP